MHVLHVSRYVHVGSIGGTERYILDLIRAFRDDIQSSLVWLCRDSCDPTPFEDEQGFKVKPIAVPAGYVDRPNVRVQEEFRDWIRLNLVDIIHFHTFSLSEAALAKVAVAENVPYVFTYHSPAWSCRRGDLLRWNTEICDGEIRPWRCSACLLQKRAEIPQHLAWAISGGLIPLGMFVERFASGKLRRRLAAYQDTQRFRDGFQSFLRDASYIVACTNWSIPLLERNKTPTQRIVHIPQGLPLDFPRLGITSADCKDMVLFKVGYLGRISPVKGVHILIEAFAKTRYPNARLYIYGVDETSRDPYLQHLKRLGKTDERIKLLPKLPFESVREHIQQLQLLAIPSVWLETGPLTLFEALSQKVLVWGSDRIGQIDILNQYGQTIQPNTVEAWHDALEDIFEKHANGQHEAYEVQLDELRTMSDVAQEMIAVYKRTMG